MKAIDELLDTIQNELDNNHKNWTIQGRSMALVVREGDDIVITLEGDSQITLRASLEGDTRVCRRCGKIKQGWPKWWKNISPNGLHYACPDCVEEVENLISATLATKGGGQSQGQDQKHTEESGD
jgi:hypothetical protein